MCSMFFTGFLMGLGATLQWPTTPDRLENGSNAKDKFSYRDNKIYKCKTHDDSRIFKNVGLDRAVIMG